MSQLEDAGQRFECWCIVEIMGRQTYAGYVSERTIAGAGMLQIDVPEVDESRPAFTKFISPSSLYGLSPVTEEIARHAAAKIRVRPVQEYGLLPEPKRNSPVLDSVGESERFSYRHPNWRDNHVDDDDDFEGEDDEVESPIQDPNNDNDLSNKVDDDDSGVALVPRDKDIPF